MENALGIAPLIYMYSTVYPWNSVNRLQFLSKFTVQVPWTTVVVVYLRKGTRKSSRLQFLYIHHQTHPSSPSHHPKQDIVMIELITVFIIAQTCNLHIIFCWWNKVNCTSFFTSNTYRIRQNNLNLFVSAKGLNYSASFKPLLNAQTNLKYRQHYTIFNHSRFRKKSFHVTQLEHYCTVPQLVEAFGW